MRKTIDLTKKKFGRLTVIKRVENNKRNETQWLCKCDCDEKEIIVRASCLISKHTQSCGCLQREKAREIHKKYNTYDLSGDYGVGYTSKGEEFYFDLEDYNKIKDYYWYMDDNKYLVNKSRNKNIILMHRLVTNCPDNMEVDHEFHYTWDNRKEFLRIVTKSQNAMNQKIKSNNKSGVKGVFWDNQKEKWKAQITINNNFINLGFYDNFNEAVEIRKKAEIEYFGEYNYIGD